MNIGIDIDDTIADTFSIQFNLAQKYTILDLKKSADIKKKELNKYHYYCKEYHDWSDEENLAFWQDNYKTIMENVKPKYFAKEVIKRLKEEGYKIIIITARFKLDNIDQKEITRKWLEENDIIYDKLIVDAKDKKEIARENKIDIFIDDDIENCINVSETGAKSFLMASYNNRKVNKKGIKEVYSWPHIYQEIKNI